MTLGEKLRQLRIRSGHVQRDLASPLGRSQSKWSEFEKGKARPALEEIPKIAENFGVSCDYLLRDDLEDPDDPNVRLLKIADTDRLTRLQLEEALLAHYDRDMQVVFHLVFRFGAAKALSLLLSETKGSTSSPEELPVSPLKVAKSIQPKPETSNESKHPRPRQPGKPEPGDEKAARPRPQ